MALFTHPNGVMLALILAVTTLYFDRRRVGIGTAGQQYFRTWRSAPVGRVHCTESGGFPGAIYGQRFRARTQYYYPLAALRLEISHRYMENFGLAPGRQPADA
jgi:hypothetical protein